MHRARDGRRRYRHLIIAALLLLGGCASIQPPPPQPEAIATPHPLATQAALRALEQGGNAYDAAIAASAVLSVVAPYHAGLGGGAFWLIQDDQGKSVVIDAREAAPGTLKSPVTTSAAAAAIPGLPAALTYVGRYYAERPLEADLADAIRLARSGFIVDARYQRMAAASLTRLSTNPAAARVFLKNGQVPPQGTLIRQPALARTLQALARGGDDNFYRGGIGHALLQDANRAGAQWTPEALSRYRISEQLPLRFHYHGTTFLTVPSPSTGGIQLARMFGILRFSPIPRSDNIGRIHHLAEVMRRAELPAIPAMNDSTLKNAFPQLLTTERLRASAGTIDPLQATPSTHLAQLLPNDASEQVSIIDKRGNRVSVSLTLGRPFGSGLLSPQTGILLNDALNDAHPSAAMPLPAGSRPLSSMTPLIADLPNGALVAGAAAGRNSPAILFTVITDFLDGHSAQAAIKAPRYVQRSSPDRLDYERRAFDREQLFQLQALGHRPQVAAGPLGNVQWVDTLIAPQPAVDAQSDERGIGQAIVHQPQ
ncbi:gamma-glutamyltransferase [Mangrovitalea sediminis]|uniref:gamma-glutamyltransferase n=1 Tax=Mangrovitalea sediminis TaxID=1982043 RepID=UPI000BE55FCB|nr:gamma-glutamyltransferase [Mangrovitalea sediminis]